jgi:hypothetical protein
MTNRLALLIGVRDYRGGPFPPLPVVEHDLEAMQTCLTASGYQVKSFGLGPGDGAGSTIFQQLRGFIRTAPKGCTLLIYLSGHGLHHRGKDYLVPADFDALNAEDYGRLLVPIDLAEALEDSKAHSLVIFVDACRTGVDLDNVDVKSSAFARWGKAKLARVSGHRFAIVLGCSPGQFCQFVSGSEPFSLFTRALVSGLSPEHPARSLADVVEAAQQQLDHLVTLHGKCSQRIHVLSEQSSGGPFGRDLVICDAYGGGTPAGSETDSWSASVSQSLLWAGIKGGPGAVSERLKDRVLAIVGACWRQSNERREKSAEDPWLDESFPSRVLDRLSFLIEHSDPRIDVTVGERALLLVAPFLREAVLGHGLRLAAAANPFRPSPVPAGDWHEPYRGKLEQAFQSSPQFVRKAARMLELKRPEDYKAVLQWLVHRAVLRDPELWLAAPSGLLPQGILQSLDAGAGSGATNPEELAVNQLFESSVALELAKCICSDPARLERDDGSQVLNLTRQLAPATPFEQTIRPRALGYLLSLAGWLAIDPRLFSDVVVDHVGLSNPLTPSALLRNVRLASWRGVGRTRSLHITCEHPAADLAFREYTSRAAGVLVSCHVP